VSSLAIGIPGFFLAMAPANQRARTEFAKRVLRFTVPTGLIVGTAVLVTYAIARQGDVGTLQEHRTTATIVLVALSLVVLGLVIRPGTPWRLGLVLLMVVLGVLAFTVDVGQDFYELHTPPDSLLATALVVAAVGAVVLEVLWRLGVLRIAGHRPDDAGDDPGSAPVDEQRLHGMGHPTAPVVDEPVGVADAVVAEADG
jgi:cation-transporting ATPase E